MSRFSDRFEASAWPFLLNDLGETVTRYPLGIQADAVSGITGIFNEDKPDHQSQDGERVARHGSIRVATSVTPDKRDAWNIRGEVWQATTVKAPLGGFVVVALERTDRILSHGNEGITQL
mgnify:CR=1 FL=1